MATDPTRASAPSRRTSSQRGPNRTTTRSDSGYERGKVSASPLLWTPHSNQLHILLMKSEAEEDYHLGRAQVKAPQPYGRGR